MEHENYNFIADLDTITDSWKLKVRILRLWKTTFQLDMIIMDERADKIQATVKKALFPVFDKVLEEGMVVMLSKFGVGANNTKYPLLRHAYKVNYHRCTQVKKCVRFDGPIHGFRCFPFGDILNHINDPDLPVDVIGCVLHCGNMETYDKGYGKEGRRMTLELEDPEGLKVKCTLWDDYAEQFHNYVATTNIENHVVIILQFGRIRMWKGNPTLQNALFGSSFIARVGASISSQGGSQLSSQRVNSLREEFLTKTKKSTIDEIVDSMEPMACVVLATIRSMEQQHGWFYIACRRHHTKVVKKSEFGGLEDIDVDEAEDDGSLYCSKCKGKASSVFPSYKVQVRVQDSTGSTSFVLFDRDVCKLLHKSAFDLREKQEMDGEGDTFPDEFGGLVDQRFLFKVDVS